MDKLLSSSRSWPIVAMLLLTAVMTWPAAVGYSQGQQPERIPSVGEAPAQIHNGAKPQSPTAQGGGVLHPLDFQRVQWAYHSLYITAIGVVGCILALFICLYYGKDVKNRFEPFFGDGQVTQLVVIIAVAGNVCSLAIAGILGASEVSAIYGGIVGYVLGRGKKSGDSEPATQSTSKNAQDAAGREP